MRYRITAVYTPDNVDADRRRQASVFEADTKNLAEAAVAGVAALQLPYSDQEVAGAAEEAVDDPDCPFIAFELFSGDGRHDVEVETFDVAETQAVTRENLLAWVRGRCDGSDEQVRSELAGILGHWFWRTTDGYGRNELQDALHECRLNGYKGYRQMTVDELLDEMFAESGLIDGQRDQYDEASRIRPFGINTMIKADEALWLGK